MMSFPNKGRRGSLKGLSLFFSLLIIISCTSCPMNLELSPRVSLEKSWSVPLPVSGLNHAIMDRDILYVPLVWGLAAIDLKTGNLLWKTDGITETVSNPVRLGDELFYLERNPMGIPFTEYKQRIARFGIDGSFKGYINIGSGKYIARFSSLAAKGEYLYWGTGGYVDTNEYPGFVRLHIPSLIDNGGSWTGQPETLYENGTETSPVPLFDNEYIFIYAQNRDWTGSRLVKINESTGLVVGDYAMPGFIGGNHYKALDLYGDNIIMNGVWGFFSLSKDGKVLGRWDHKKEETYDAMCTSHTPTLSGKYLVFTSINDGTLFPNLPNIACFNIETMRPQWGHVYPDSLGSTPQAANGICYVTTMNETLLFNLETGALLGKDENVKGCSWQNNASFTYNDLMVYTDDAGISAFKMNYKAGFFGNLEKM
jgi:hypothetical protein